VRAQYLVPGTLLIVVILMIGIAYINLMLNRAELIIDEKSQLAKISLDKPVIAITNISKNSYTYFLSVTVNSTRYIDEIILDTGSTVVKRNCSSYNCSTVFSLDSNGCFALIAVGEGVYWFYNPREDPYLGECAEAALCVDPDNLIYWKQLCSKKTSSSSNSSSSYLENYLDPLFFDAYGYPRAENYRGYIPSSTFKEYVNDTLPLIINFPRATSDICGYMRWHPAIKALGGWSFTCYNYLRSNGLPTKAGFYVLLDNQTLDVAILGYNVSGYNWQGYPVPDEWIFIILWGNGTIQKINVMRTSDITYVYSYKHRLGHIYNLYANRGGGPPSYNHKIGIEKKTSNYQLFILIDYTDSPIYITITLEVLDNRTVIGIPRGSAIVYSNTMGTKTNTQTIIVENKGTVIYRAEYWVDKRISNWSQSRIEIYGVIFNKPTND